MVIYECISIYQEICTKYQRLSALDPSNTLYPVKAVLYHRMALMLMQWQPTTLDQVVKVNQKAAPSKTELAEWMKVPPRRKSLNTKKD